MSCVGVIHSTGFMPRTNILSSASAGENAGKVRPDSPSSVATSLHPELAEERHGIVAPVVEIARQHERTVRRFFRDPVRDPVHLTQRAGRVSARCAHSSVIERPANVARATSRPRRSKRCAEMSQRPPRSSGCGDRIALPCRHDGLNTFGPSAICKFERAWRFRLPGNARRRRAGRAADCRNRWPAPAAACAAPSLPEGNRRPRGSTAPSAASRCQA